MKIGLVLFVGIVFAQSAAAQLRERPAAAVRIGTVTISFVATNENVIIVSLSSKPDAPGVLDIGAAREFADSARLIAHAHDSRLAGERLTYRYGQQDLAVERHVSDAGDAITLSIGATVIRLTIAQVDSVTSAIERAIPIALEMTRESPTTTTALPTARENYPPTPLEIFIPPLPTPRGMRGYHFVADFDVDEKGKILNVIFDPTPDIVYNRKLEASLSTLRFHPGTTPNGTPIRGRYRMVMDF